VKIRGINLLSRIFYLISELTYRGDGKKSGIPGLNERTRGMVGVGVRGAKAPESGQIPLLCPFAFNN